LASCGKRGDPLPPLPRTPQPVTGFTVAQRADVLEVAMVAPRLTTGGARLDVLELELLRMEGPGELDKAGKKLRFRAAPGERLVETFPLPPVGTPLKLAARAVHRGQLSAMGKLVSMVVQAPPPPPPTLTAQLRPTGVLLTWSMPVLPSPPPPSPSPGASPSAAASPAAAAPASPSPSPAAGPGTKAPPAGASPAPAPAPTPPPPPRVRLYRSSGQAGDPQPLAPEPLAGTTFEDAGAAQGQTWCYTARLVIGAEPMVESAGSPQACLEVKDVFPPAAPTGLSALVQEAEVEVSWSPSTDADLKGYRLYRATGGAPPQRVAEVEAGRTSARDTPPAAASHVYTLTAVDQQGNESPPSAPAEVRKP
jgi:hypothetical protein